MTTAKGAIEITVPFDGLIIKYNGTEATVIYTFKGVPVVTEAVTVDFAHEMISLPDVGGTYRGKVETR